MYIRGRQSEIGVQGSRHRVTSCNERARIDVEESQGNEDDDDDDDGDETRWERKGAATRVKGQGKEMKKRSGRSRVSNSAMAITSLLLRVVFRRLSTITGCFENEAACPCARARARTERIVRIFDRRGIALVTEPYGEEPPSPSTKSPSDVVIGDETRCDVRVETFLHFCDHFCIS